MKDPTLEAKRLKRMMIWHRMPCTHAQRQTMIRLATQLPAGHPLETALARLPVPLRTLSKLNAAVWIDGLRDALGLATRPIGGQ